MQFFHSQLNALVLLLCVICTSRGQGTFQNLGFEAASLVPIVGDPYGRVQFSQAFPGWAGYVGTNEQTRALYDNYFLDTSGISIIDSGWTNQLGASRGLIEGNFSAILQAGFGSLQIGPANTSIAQTGLIPGTAQSLLFKAQSLLPPGQDLETALV